ncbi:hypothetical protein [Dyella japonica]|uniref:Uncharacterized protein n=1 Tax=Dyella japonica TaxID=231455 RepID=A0ABV2K1E2_9GAMM
MKKGMIYSPSHGDTEFTVPLFDEFMKRTMGDMSKHGMWAPAARSLPSLLTWCFGRRPIAAGAHTRRQATGWAPIHRAVTSDVALITSGSARCGIHA